MQALETYDTIPVIPVEDDLLHTNETPFCSDVICFCHEDPLLIVQVASFVEDGLLTPAEATALVAGHLL